MANFWEQIGQIIENTSEGGGLTVNVKVEVPDRTFILLGAALLGAILIGMILANVITMLIANRIGK